jgi:hypothetical protein
MENIHKANESRKEELLAAQKFEAFITSLAHIVEKYGLEVLAEADDAA